MARLIDLAEELFGWGEREVPLEPVREFGRRLRETQEPEARKEERDENQRWTDLDDSHRS